MRRIEFFVSTFRGLGLGLTFGFYDNCFICIGTFLSLIQPNEWNREHIGSFKYNHDNKWIKID